MTDDVRDVIVVGGGIVGLATAFALSEVSVTIIEAEPRIATHQTGHNSGVIHAGLYYRPGSKKARHCSEGRRALLRFCSARGVPFERCGKVVVATKDAELEALAELERRGRANGLTEIRRLEPEAIQEIEPHVRCRAGLHVAETGIIDYRGVAHALQDAIVARGGAVRTDTTFVAAQNDGGTVAVETSKGRLRCRLLVACAGLQADRVARACRVEPGVRIVPFRGEYFVLKEERRPLVKNLIYPVPDPELPFLGVHFTRRIDGEIEAGPNAVLSWKRHGYKKGSFQLADAWATASFPGFWRLASRYARTGLTEAWRSWSPARFVRSLQSLVPEITEDDVRPGGAGIRAQALAPDGRLLDDFHIVERAGMIHVLNAPSPAATASLSIGHEIASLARKQLGLPARRLLS